VYKIPLFLLEMTASLTVSALERLDFEAEESAGLACTIILLPAVPGAPLLALGDFLRGHLGGEFPNTSQNVFPRDR
jgi:hypothetical protein